MAKPKFFFNEYGPAKGFPWAGTEAFTAGTGTESAVSLGRNLSNGLKLEMVDTTASQSFVDVAMTCPAGIWCAILVEIVDMDLTNYSGAVGSNAPIKNATSTNLNAAVALDDRIVTYDQLKAGGIGWYCIWMKYDVTSAAPVIRCGFGTDAGMTDGAGYITVGRVGAFRLQQDNAEPSTTDGVPSYALPNYGASYDVTGNKVDANDRVIWGTTSVGDIDRYSVLYAIGDSKADEKGTDSPTTLASRAPISCYPYAASGQGFDYMAVTKLTDLQAKMIQNTTESIRDFWPDMDELPQTPLNPNALLYCNFGVNDIDGADYTSTQLVDNFESLAATLGYADVIITELSPWGASINSSAGEITETKAFNTKARTKCRANDWVFVPIYHALGDNPTNPDNMLNPTYTTDDLHPVGPGSNVVDRLIVGAIDEYLQRGTS